MSLRKTVKHLLIVIFTIYTGSLFAVTPSAEQIEQFKKLPKSQQEALAKQYGVDITQLEQMMNPMQSGELNANNPQSSTIQARKIDYTQASQRDLNDPRYSNDGELKPFGYNVFAGKPTTFTPVDDLPVPNNYLLGVGDQIHIQTYGKLNQQQSLTISRNGSISFPSLGPIYVAGQTFEQAKTFIESSVKKQILGVEVSVSMGALRTSQVAVFGDAYQPGSYNVNAFSTATQVLKAAGGIDTVGSLRNIEIRRENKVIQKLDLYNFLVSGDTSGDIRLESGDAIFIPARSSSIYIRGEVVRPAIYETVKGESLDAVLMNAGGLTADAYQESISIRRKTSDGIKVFNLDMNTAKGQQFKVKDGDEIVARTKANYFTSDIAIRGAVIRPGVYEYSKGDRIADVFKTIDGSLNANADLTYAIIVREINQHRDIKVLQFKLGEAITNPNSKENLSLQTRDQILVFSGELDGEFWYGEGQNKTREDWQNEQLAKNLADQQRELMMQQLAMNQAGQQGSQGKGQQVSGNSAVNSNVQQNSNQFGVVGQQDGNEIAEAGNTQTSSRDNGSNLKLKDLEKKEEQQEIDFDSRENLLEPVIKRLVQQASLGSNVQIVEVRGAVKFPGIYPLAENTVLSDLVVAGGGLRESAYEFTGELSRVESAKGLFNIQHQRINVDAILQGDTKENLKLVSKDRLNVFTKPEWREDYSVELLGEVTFPGTYTFKRGETIADIIQRAGGVTEYAYPQGAIFSRESLRIQEGERMKLLDRQLRQEIASLTLRRQSSSARYTSSPAEAMAIADQLGNTEPVGRMVISLNEILDGEKQADVLLENKDKIYIPPLRKVVSVIGEVQYSSSHLFDDRLTLEDYLNRSGGAKRQADVERMYVIRANGSVMLPNNSFWFSRSTEDLEPGDTIVVPIDSDYLDSLSAWTSATQILYQVGVAWNAIQN